MAWFPTVEWLEEYRDTVNADEEYAEHASDWGDGWNGDFLFEIRNLPLDEHTVSDLPDELLALERVPDDVWEGVDESAREKIVGDMGDTPVHELPDELPDPFRQGLPDDLRERLDRLEEFFDEEPAFENAADELPEELEDTLPPRLDDLMTQLEDLVTDEGQVYAHIGLEAGECTEVRAVTSREESDASFVLYGEYKDWKELIQGGDPIQLVMSGKLELDGDLNRVMEYSEAAQRLAGVSADMDTRYIF